MIWAIVYVSLGLVSLGLLSVPAVRVAKEVRALSRTVAKSERRLEDALNRLDAANRER